MSTEMNAVVSAFLNDAYSIFLQRELWLFADPKPAGIAPRSDGPTQQQATLSDGIELQQANSSKNVLGILRSPGLTTTDDAVKLGLWTVLNSLSASTGLKGPGDPELAQGVAEKNGRSMADRQDGVSRIIQAYPHDAKANAAVEARQKLNEIAASKAKSVNPIAMGEETERSDLNLRMITQNSAVLIDALSQLTASSEGEFELPVILNAGMIPGAEQVKAPLRQLRPMQFSSEQMLAALHQLGLEPSLMEKLKRLLANLKGSKKVAKAFLSVLFALLIVGERIVEELSLFMEEEEDIKERLAYADTHGFIDDRRRVYL